MTTESEDLRQKVTDLAVESYKGSLNCAESVLSALIRAGALNLPPEAVGLATGFGGGIGLAKSTCGALSAAVMAAGAVHGRSDPWSVDPEKRSRELGTDYYPHFRELAEEFRQAHGSLLCRDICADYLNNWAAKERRVRCLKVVAATAALAYDFMTRPRVRPGAAENCSS